MKRFFSFLLLFFFFTNCADSISKDELTENVKRDINAEFSKRASKNDINFSIVSFDLLHKEGKEYSGVMKTLENGIEYTYQVDVSVDGEAYMWKIVQ